MMQCAVRLMLLLWQDMTEMIIYFLTPEDDLVLDAPSGRAFKML